MHDSEMKNGSSRGPSNNVFISNRETRRFGEIYVSRPFLLMEIASDVDT